MEDFVEVAVPGVAVNPIHNVLALCGVDTEEARAVFINVEGLNSVLMHLQCWTVIKM